MRTARRFLFVSATVITGLFTLAGLTLPVFAASPVAWVDSSDKASPDLKQEVRDTGDLTTMRVIVRYAPGTNLATGGTLSGGTLVRNLAGLGLAVVEVKT